MKTFKFKTFCRLILIASTALTFVGCNKSSDDDNKEGGLGGPVEPMSFRQALVSIIAGNYTGQCLKYPEGTALDSSISISQAGQVTAPGASGSLLGDQVNFSFVRKFTNGIADSATFAAVDISSEKGLNLNLETKMSDSTSNASARQGVGVSPGLKCAQSPETLALKEKSLYAAVSQFFVNSKKDLNCVSSGSAQELQFEVTQDQAKIGQEVFNLTSNLESETVAVLPRTNSLVYSIETTDNRELSLTLNDKNSVDLLSYKDQNGKQFGCVP